MGVKRLRLREARERAADPDAEPDELAQLADYADPAVRLAVAQHANTSPAVRELLAKDPIDAIRFAAETREDGRPLPDPDEVVVVAFGANYVSPWWSIATAVAVGVIAGGTVLFFVWGYLLVRGLESALKG